MQTGSFQWMKSINKSIVLNKIRSEGPISRAQIAKETNLTPPTVSANVRELIEQGIVKESRLGDSQGGRKPTMLVINSSDFYIIGLDAGPTEVEFGLADLSGTVIHHLRANINLMEETAFLNVVKKGIHDLLNEIPLMRDKVIGIGVAMHGVVDISTGTSLFAPNLHLRNIPIKEELEKEFGFLVKVENDARAMALGEAWFGSGENVTSMVAVNVGRGIGSGVVINGELYHGEYDIAGELGHMAIDVHGRRCACGSNGCLQTVASGPAVAERAVESLKNHSESKIWELIEGDLGRVSGEIIFTAAEAGDPLAADILRQTGEYLGIGLTNLIHIINPTKIIIGGGVSASGKYVLDQIRQTIQERALTQQAKQTKVVITEFGSQATMLGAVALLLVELFQPQ
ncbi:sugar kinase [Marinococcus halophilus]|uniref:Serine/threonine protein kinase n=1 Tax=Marinococcus halophilus TaxID=1371 RepID=A0A510Y2Y8_MARHA|nr:ROK family transcriptional regulator [Marinococcus halophilus]OZT81735.1 sugar kinase [Marinococcus halophilus]GEK57690.1 serine/threonine protein kinase [Marinococcus halophilus]